MHISAHNRYVQYKQDVRDKVRYLRQKGFSLGQISKETSVPRTTIRTWIRDIILSKNQVLVLKNRVQKSLQKGRMRFQAVQKEKRQKNEKELLEIGQKEIGKLSPRDFLIAGVSLYWAEGFKNKHEHRLGFCNSDPAMIKFYVYWLEKYLGIDKDQLVARLTLNYLYKDNVNEMQSYWARIIGISLNQFSKPFFQTSKWKKQYNAGNYRGVLRIHVKESLNHLLKMKGWIEGLKMLK